MKLVCNATTPQELREEIVSLLLHRATQQTALATISSKTVAHQQEYAATVLGNLAMEVKDMEIVNSWPSGLTEQPGTPAPEIDMRVWNLEGWGEVSAANLQMGWTSNPNFKHYTQLAIGESADGHVKGSIRAERITRIR